MTTNDMKLPWRMAYTDTGAAVIDEDNFFLAEDIGISQAAYICKAANMFPELVRMLEYVYTNLTTPVHNPHNDRWVKRDSDTGRFMDMKADSGKFKGVTREKPSK